MGTFRGTGANPDRKEDIVKNQTELLPTTDEELRRGEGEGGWAVGKERNGVLGGVGLHTV